ncbi:MAG: hypothetical protein RLZZ126_1132 [Pseudomonadota bacterium]
MNFHLHSPPTQALAALARSDCDTAVLFMGNEALGKEPAKAKAPARSPLLKLAMQLAGQGDFEAGAGKLVSVPAAPGVVAQRLLLAHVGDGTPAQVRKAAVAVAGSLKGNTHAKRISLAAASGFDGPQLRAAILGLAEGSYVYSSTKSKPKGRHLVSVEVIADNVDALQADLDWAVACMRGIELAKEWGNRPANHATPVHLAQAARALGKTPKTTCEVLGPKQIAKLKMGSFLAVAQGSRNEPRFIVLKYQGAPASVAPHVLVGKGITFDTGGISLKPAAEMDEMKFDMCGAASVLGVFEALSVLKPAINVVGLIPTCENMPGGDALKPGDVVTSMAGQTIEVLNTDAEGRLILCDALTYAERFKPQSVVDIATLTGACVVALGHVRTGMYASNDELAAQLTRAGDAAQDPCWRMPLDDEYAEGLKTHFADVANVAGRAGGSITAAKFLQRFAAKYDWAHLDIAGTAWKSGAAKGSTGRPVGLLLQYLTDQT